MADRGSGLLLFNNQRVQSLICKWGAVSFHLPQKLVLIAGQLAHQDDKDEIIISHLSNTD